jgi:hypothetical protein
MTKRDPNPKMRSIVRVQVAEYELWMEGCGGFRDAQGEKKKVG